MTSLEARARFRDPYFAMEPERYENDAFVGFAVGNDFNREIIRPGWQDDYPDGVIGIRVDDDFWVVAALPYEEYKDVAIKDIVAELWPDVTNPEFKSDSIQGDLS